MASQNKTKAALLAELNEIKAQQKQADTALKRLLALGRTLISTQDVQQILDQAIKTAVEITPAADRGSIQVYDSNGDTLETMALGGSDDELLERIHFKPGLGVAGTVFASQKLINVPDVLQDDRFVPGNLPLRVRSLLVAPLNSQDKRFGTLSLSSQQVDAFSDTDESFIQLIADQTTSALENDHLVSSLRKSQLATHQAEERVRAFIQNVDDLVYFRNLDGAIGQLDIANLSGLGYKPAEFEADPELWRKVIHPEDRDGVRAFFAQHPEGTHSFSLTYRLQHKKGGWRWMQSHLVGAKKGEQTYSGYYCVDRDITDLKAAQEAAEKYEFIANTSEEFMTLINRDYRYEAANSAYCHAHKMQREEVVAKTVADVWGVERFEENIRSCLERCFLNQTVHFQGWFEFSALGTRYVDVTYYPYKEKDGWVSHAVVVSHDITEMKQTQDELARHHDHLEKLVAERTQALTESNERLSWQVEERQRAEAAANHQAEVMRALYDTSLEVNSQLDIDTLLKTIVRRALTLLDVGQGALSLIEPDRKSLKQVVAVGPLQSYFGTTLKIGEGIWGQVALNGKPMMLANDSQKNKSRITIPEPFERILCVPLKIHNKIIGVLTVLDDKNEVFKEDSVQLLSAFAAQAAIAIENARLYDEAQQQIIQHARAELQIHELNQKLIRLQTTGTAIVANLDLRTMLETVAQEIVYLLGFEGCAIVAENDRRIVAEYFHPSLEMSHNASRIDQVHPLGSVIRLAEPMQHIISQSDIPPDISRYMHELRVKTLFLLPIIYRGNTVGLIELIARQEEVLLSKEEIQLAQLLTSQVAVAIQNAKLFEQVNTELRERKRAEVTLIEERNLLRTLIDNLPDHIFVKDTEARLVLTNAAYARFFGTKSPEELACNTVFDLYATELAEQYNDNDISVIETGQPIINEEMSGFDLAGAKRWFLSTKVPIFDHEGEIKGLVGISRNITELKQREEAIRKSEANLQALIDNSDQVLVLLDYESRIQAFNKAASRAIRFIFGQKLQIGKLASDYIWDQFRPEYENWLQQAMSGKLTRIEQQIPFLDDNWFELTFAPITLDDGQLIGICFTMTNIDKHKRIIDTLAESEAQLQAKMQSVQATAQMLVSEVDLNELLKSIIVQTEAVVECDGVAVLHANENQRLSIAMVSKTSSNNIIGKYLSEDEVWSYHLLANQQMQLSTATQNDEQLGLLRSSLQLYDLEICLCTPLRVQEKQLGVLVIWRNHENQFTIADRRLIALFASQVSLALHNAYLHEQNRQLAIEQERTRLAQDLHDTVTQSLYSIGMATSTALKLLEQGQGEDQLRRPITYASDLSRKALSEMRQTIYHLVPASLSENGLVDVLTQHCQTLTSNYGLAIDMQFVPDLVLSNEHQETLFYIAKEALWNVIKYADATHVTIELAKSKDNIVLSVIDNGIGFEPAEFIPQHQFGLKNMQTRANRLGGTVQVHSQEKKGTTVEAQLPISTNL